MLGAHSYFSGVSTRFMSIQVDALQLCEVDGACTAQGTTSAQTMQPYNVTRYTMMCLTWYTAV
jgi:hypothetical protein